MVKRRTCIGTDMIDLTDRRMEGGVRGCLTTSDRGERSNRELKNLANTRR
jgi:hypothetical protein